MNSNMWAPLFGIWLLGMLMAAIIARTRSIRFWLTTAVDLAVFSFLITAALAGMATLSDRSEELLGISTDWINIAWSLVCFLGLMSLKSWHDRGKFSETAEKT